MQLIKKELKYYDENIDFPQRIKTTKKLIEMFGCLGK